jgi:hypothetical protein
MKVIAYYKLRALIHSSFSEWNLLLVQPLEKLYTVLHAVPHLLTEFTNFL